MSEVYTVEWEIEDGYAGGGRPQKIDIEICDFEGMDEEEIKDELSDIIQEDFDQKVSWSADTSEMAAAIKSILDGDG